MGEKHLTDIWRRICCHLFQLSQAGKTATSGMWDVLWKTKLNQRNAARYKKTCDVVQETEDCWCVLTCWRWVNLRDKTEPERCSILLETCDMVQETCDSLCATCDMTWHVNMNLRDQTEPERSSVPSQVPLAPRLQIWEEGRIIFKALWKQWYLIWL